MGIRRKTGFCSRTEFDLLEGKCPHFPMLTILRARSRPDARAFAVQLWPLRGSESPRELRQAGTPALRPFLLGPLRGWNRYPSAKSAR